MVKFPFPTSFLKCAMSVAALPGEMLGALSRLRPIPLSLVGWCASCDNNNNNNNNNINNWFIQNLLKGCFLKKLCEMKLLTYKIKNTTFNTLKQPKTSLLHI